MIDFESLSFGLFFWTFICLWQDGYLGWVLGDTGLLPEYFTSIFLSLSIGKTFCPNLLYFAINLWLHRRYQLEATGYSTEQIFFFSFSLVHG
jgi:hypothetical protein